MAKRIVQLIGSNGEIVFPTENMTVQSGNILFSSKGGKVFLPLTVETASGDAPMGISLGLANL